MRVECYFEDYLLGSKFRTDGRTVTEADLVNFAYLSGDWFPLHVDVEYAKKSAFRERVAHGMLILAIASGLLVRYGLISPTSFLALLGLNDVRFKRPVKIGDTLYVEVEIVSKEDKDDAKGTITAGLIVRNQHGDEVAAFKAIALVKKKTVGVNAE